MAFHLFYGERKNEKRCRLLSSVSNCRKRERFINFTLARGNLQRVWEFAGSRDSSSGAQSARLGQGHCFGDFG